ncbi:MAG: AraC family transcriptional regulator [Gemmataceae bacterium]|nr:AraC family transcriptional regulator [Gemmataceae bacterium]
MKRPSAHSPWPPPEMLDFPRDLIQPSQDESHVAYYRATPRPFVFLHSSHLPPGTVTGSHSHPCVALHGCLQGPLVLASADGEQVFDAGVFFLVESGRRHHWRNPGTHMAANLSVLIDHRHPGAWATATGVKECVRDLSRLVRGLRRFNAAQDEDLKHSFWQIADYLMAHRPRKQAAATGMLLSLIGRIVELMGEAPEDPALQTDVAEQIRRLLLARVSDRVSLEEVAREVFLSPTRVKQIFWETYGCGIMAYFNQLKIWQAKRLLGSSSLTVEQVSRKLGFSSPSYFSRVFLRCTGESPTDFRSQPE